MWKLAIDMGSSMTKIYRADTSSGVVLAEPSCVAIAGEDGEIKAIGKEAKGLLGKTAKNTSIIYPVYEGEIYDMRLAVALLKQFLARIGVKSSALRRAQVLFSVPCGISEEALAAYAELVEECGLRKVFFVEQPYLAAAGAGAVLSDFDPVFCIDVGGGVTNIAVVSADGIISGVSINLGGNNIDDEIRKRVERDNGLRVGALTAERIKNEIGSLSGSARGQFVAYGNQRETFQPSSVSVHASQVKDCIGACADMIIQYANAVLKKLPAEVAATVYRNGVYLSGGVMKLPYLPKYIADELKITPHVSEEPQYATVLGGGTLIVDKPLMRRLAKNVDE